MADEVKTNTENETDETETVEAVEQEVENAPEEETAPVEDADNDSNDDNADSDLSEEVKKWKSLSRKNEERAAENKRLLEQFVEDNKSFHEERETFNKERADFIKERALTTAGLSTDLSALITGSTAEEIEAQVQLITKSLPTAQVEETKPVGVSYTPVEATVDTGSDFQNMMREARLQAQKSKNQ